MTNPLSSIFLALSFQPRPQHRRRFLLLCLQHRPLHLLWCLLQWSHQPRFHPRHVRLCLRSPGSPAATSPPPRLSLRHLLLSTLAIHVCCRPLLCFVTLPWRRADTVAHTQVAKRYIFLLPLFGSTIKGTCLLPRSPLPFPPKPIGNLNDACPVRT